jgi:Chaperone of endosialidase
MPADDLVLNVRQIAGYGEASNAINTDAILIQRGGLGGPYLSIEAATLVATALSAPGGNMTVGGALSAISFSGGSAQFSNAYANVFGAQTACIGNLSITTAGSLGGVQIATVNDLADLAASSVNSFNGRVGAVQLWIDDIRCAGGAPIYSPRFSGSPRADTPPPWSNSTRLATTMFVQGSLAQLTLDFAPIDSPNFTGVPTAPTAAVGASDGQIATTAFVQNAVAESVSGVASFNGRTGLVVLTTADVTNAGAALLASPIFTGTPQAPTATPGTSSAQLATCAFVAAAVSAAAGVSSFNGRTGDVTLTSADVASIAVTTFNGRAGAVTLLANDISAAGGALLAGPAFTGAPTAPTAALGTSTTQLATTAFVQAAVAAVTAGVSSFNSRTGAVTLTAPDISAAGGALLAGPAFTGVPTAPTATPGVATTQLATCAFVAAAVSAGTAGVASFNSRTGAVTLLVADISAAGGALLASPAFTGIPTAPTATTATSTTQLATTAFVHAALPIASTAAPLMDGTAAAGVATAWSRGDHVHPTDTSRAAASALANYVPLAGGLMTGSLTIQPGAAANGLSVTRNVTTNLTAILLFDDVGANARGSIYFDHNAGAAAIANNLAGTTLLLDGSGGFSYLSGSGVATKTGGGSWTAASDDRIKTVTGEYALGLDAVMQLRPVEFVYKGNDTPTANLSADPRLDAMVARTTGVPAPYRASPHHDVAKNQASFVGFVAQELERICPSMVTKKSGFIDGNPVADLRQVDVSNLVYILVNAVKALTARVESLERTAT